jgi:signal peptidase II
MVWGVAFIVCCLDQLTKVWAIQALSGGRRIELVDNFLRFEYTTNPGGAAGMLGDSPLLLTALSVVALGIIVWWARMIPRDEKFARAGFGLILGGAVGNLIDRLFRGGFLSFSGVVDFIQAHWYDRAHWPTFNVADSAICIGIALVIFTHVIAYRREAAQEAGAGESANGTTGTGG